MLSVSKVIVVLLLSALGAISSICAGAAVVYYKTQHLIDARDWIDHTETVLAALQSQNTRLERIDNNLQLYKVTGDESYLRSAHTAVAALEVGLLRLRELVKDNPSQAHHVEEQEQAIEVLSRSIDTAAAMRKMPEQAQRACQGIVSVMLEEERQLERQRTAESHVSLSQSLFSGIGYLVFSILVICVLFGFLLRDAVQRRDTRRSFHWQTWSWPRRLRSRRRVRERLHCWSMRETNYSCASRFGRLISRLCVTLKRCFREREERR